MPSIKDMTEEQLELFIEHKILEILGDPDFELGLRDEFKQKLVERLQDWRRISHDEVVREFGEG